VLRLVEEMMSVQQDIIATPPLRLRGDMTRVIDDEACKYTRPDNTTFTVFLIWVLVLVSMDLDDAAVRGRVVKSG